MGFLNKLFGIGGQGASSKDSKTIQDGNGLFIFIQCNRCGEKIKLRLRKTDELQRLENNQNGASFFVKKMVMGSNCFNRMESTIEFDARYNVVHSEIENGKLLSVAEFNQDSSANKKQ